jgi:hypothetical protein
MTLTIRPLTPSRWPALEDLFGKAGACNGCWCIYWRIGAEYHKRAREKNKRALYRIVKQGPPPGLLAFDGERPVGWCQLIPRRDLGWLNRKPVLEVVRRGAGLGSLLFLYPARASQTWSHDGSHPRRVESGEACPCSGTGSISNRHCATWQYVQRVHGYSFYV